MDDDKITKLPVAFKDPGGSERFLKVVRRKGCQHDGPYLIDTRVDHVECGKCGDLLSAVWVLGRLANYETRWHETSKRYRDEMKRLDERTRTQCKHCGKMTKISRR